MSEHKIISKLTVQGETYELSDSFAREQLKKKVSLIGQEPNTILMTDENGNLNFINKENYEEYLQNIIAEYILKTIDVEAVDEQGNPIFTF